MARGTDTERRLHSLEQRLQDIDTNGTRASVSVSAQVANQAADIAGLVGKLEKIDAKIDSAARVRFTQYLGLAMALLPIYVLLFLSLFHVTPA